MDVQRDGDVSKTKRPDSLKVNRKVEELGAKREKISSDNGSKFEGDVCNVEDFEKSGREKHCV